MLKLPSVDLTDGVQYPVEVAVDSGVDTRHPLGPTEPRAEGDDSNQMRSEEWRAGTVDVSHETTAAVPHTGVLPGLAASADLSGGQHAATLGVDIPVQSEAQCNVGRTITDLHSSESVTLTLRNWRMLAGFRPVPVVAPHPATVVATPFCPSSTYCSTSSW